LLNYIPSVLYQITPLSVLLAVLVMFGLMQKTNEITAMKATGVSIYRTVVPILIIAIAMAGGLFVLDQWYLPYANKRVETLKNMSFENGWQRSFDGDTVSDFHPFEVGTFAELNEPPTYFKKEVKQYDEMNYEELRSYIFDLQQSGFDVVRLRVQLQKKIAFP